MKMYRLANTAGETIQAAFGSRFTRLFGSTERSLPFPGSRHEATDLPLRTSAPTSLTANRQHWGWLMLLWALVTAYNLFKSYHIDDTAYLGISRWIASNPLHPMSGLLNWAGVNEPIHKTNQPPLYFYLLALWGRVFGFTEPAMHSLQSLAALACVIQLHRLARAFAAPSAMWATALIVLGPAFIVEQNVMVDVPLLAVWLAFFNALICDINTDTQTRRYVIAGVACSAALLIKYSSLVLLPILCLSLLLEKRRAQVWTALIPVATIAAWSLFNYFDYGSVHIATRPGTDDHAHHLLKAATAWCLALGALTPLGLIAAVQSRPKWAKERTTYTAMGVSFAALIAGVAIGIISDRQSDYLLPAVFAANGVLICLFLAPEVLALSPHKFWGWKRWREFAPKIYLVLWVLGTSAFYIIFAQFIAARHVLLILPAATVLLVTRWGTNLTRRSKVFGLTLTVVVSTGLCSSDWRIAAFYRSEAAEMAHSLPRAGAIWACGHWGWQWYAEQNGLQEIDVQSSPVQTGDLLVVAKEVDRQIPSNLALRLVRTDIQGSPLLNLFCTGRDARFYDFPARFGPWSLSRNCISHIDVFRVEAVSVTSQVFGSKSNTP